MLILQKISIKHSLIYKQYVANYVPFLYVTVEPN